MNSNESLLRWGLMAPGQIANTFAKAVTVVPDTRIFAVGSRSLDRSREFAERWDIPRTYGSYGELAEDSGIDAVYIASPHRYHAEQVRLALDAGKHVLCEKPITVNADEYRSLTDQARSKGLFLMEAMWSRFLPTYQTLKKDWIAQGRLGEILRIDVDFSIDPPFDAQGRLFNPELAGGALLDLGVYPLNLVHWLLGRRPSRVTSSVRMSSTGVDQRSGILMDWEDGPTAVISIGLDVRGSMTATILGDKGMAEIPQPFFGGETLIFRNDDGEERFHQAHRANGFEYQIEEACRCIRAGLLETPDHPWSATLDVLEIMDDLRSDWGLVYPFEG